MNRPRGIPGPAPGLIRPKRKLNLPDFELPDFKARSKRPKISGLEPEAPKAPYRPQEGYRPGPEEIAEKSAEIQAGWTKPRPSSKNRGDE